MISKWDIRLRRRWTCALQGRDGDTQLEGMAYSHAHQNEVHIQLSLELSWFSGRYRYHIRQLSLELGWFSRRNKVYGMDVKTSFLNGKGWYNQKVL